MIWLVLVAMVFVAGGAWLVSKSMATRGIVALAGVVAAGGYLLLGHPNMRDEPLAGRLKEIEDQARLSPDTMTAAQLMALAQERAVKAPNDPMPHWIMGQILEASGKPNEAELAFEAALRRDPNHLRTIKDLADLRFKLTGNIDAATTMLYHRVFEAEPANFRAGYMAGIGDWLQGKKAEAEALWASIEANPANDATHRQMFAAMRQMFKIDPVTPEPSKTEGGSKN